MKRRPPYNNTLMAHDWLRDSREILLDSKWSGPAIIYLLCRPAVMEYDDGEAGSHYRLEEPEFIAKVRPDPESSIPRWRMATVIQFTQNVGKRMYYDVTEMDPVEAETFGVAFEAIPVYAVDGRKIRGYD